MSFYLAGENGYVGDLATTSGLADLFTYLRGLGSESAAELVEHGYCVTPAQLIEDLAVAEPPRDTSVQATVRALVRLLGKCTDVAIVSNGEG